MEDYVIFTDSGCDIPEKELTDEGIRLLDLTFIFKGEEKIYRNREMKINDFYKRMRDGQVAQTSGINTDAFVSAFREVLSEGKDILYIGFSSALSCTYQSALNARQELEREFRERKIRMINTLCACAGQGLLVHLVNLKKKEGANLEEAATYAEKIMGSICHWFTVDDLKYLRRGGRVSAAAAAFGQILNIKPVMHVDNGGYLTPAAKVRGRKNAIKAIAEKYSELAIEKKTPVFIGHSDCEEDARYLAETVLMHNPDAEVRIYAIGPVIGAHSGPGTLALFFLGKQR